MSFMSNKIIGLTNTPALNYTYDDIKHIYHKKEEDYVAKLIMEKDNINKEDILSKLDNFSSKEELDRYIENLGNDSRL